MAEQTEVAQKPEEVSQAAAPSNSAADDGPKHPLQNCWTLWYDHSDQFDSKKPWLDNLLKIVSFQTVEDFWSVFNNIAPPSHLTPGATYHLFRTGVTPQWEDKENMEGGKHTYEFTTAKDLNAIDDHWLNLLLAMIGEQFSDDPTEICGAVLQARGKGPNRSSIRLAIWHKYLTPSRVENLRRRLIDVIGSPPKTHQAHQKNLIKEEKRQDRRR